MTRKELHYVQKEYLKAWSQDDKTLIISDLERGVEHLKGMPDNIFKETHLYTQEMEDFFGTVEGDGIQVIRKIARAETISLEERMILSTYIAAQRCRTIAAEQVSAEVTLSSFIKALEENPYDKEKIKFYSFVLGIIVNDSSESIQQVLQGLKDGTIVPSKKHKKDEWHYQITKLVTHIGEQYYDAEWHVFPSSEDANFITSDNPVSDSAVTQGASGLVSPHDFKILDHIFPLSPKFILLIRIVGKTKSRSIFYQDPINKTSVRNFNGITTQYAHRFIAGKNEAQLSSLRKAFGFLWKQKKSLRVTPENLGKATKLHSSNTSKSPILWMFKKS